MLSALHEYVLFAILGVIWCVVSYYYDVVNLYPLVSFVFSCVHFSLRNCRHLLGACRVKFFGSG